MVRAVDFVFLVGWVVFWLGWLGAAARTKPGQVQFGRAAGIRLVILVVVLVLIRVEALEGHAQNHGPWTAGVGLALFFAGLAVAVWARVHLGRNWGTPMTQKADPELVTSGPYRLVRHPIYSGLILAMIGTAVAIAFYWLVLVALLGGYFVYSATREERYMTERFPDAYPEYKRSTKMLVPFLF